jgi:hypothetical protein
MIRAREFSGVISYGYLPFAAWNSFLKMLRTLEGKHALITVRELARRRSLKQNRFYWGVVIPAVAEMFNDAGTAVDSEEVHEFLKTHVGKLSAEIVTPDGEVCPITGSTAKLGTREFEEYMEKIRAWAAQFHVSIPLPNEHLEDHE